MCGFIKCLSSLFSKTCCWFGASSDQTSHFRFKRKLLGLPLNTKTETFPSLQWCLVVSQSQSSSWQGSSLPVELFKTSRVFRVCNSLGPQSGTWFSTFTLTRKPVTTSSLSYEGDNSNIIYCEGEDASGFHSIKMLLLPALTVFNIILLGTEEQFVAERFSKHF